MSLCYYNRIENTLVNGKRKNEIGQMKCSRKIWHSNYSGIMILVLDYGMDRANRLSP